MRLLALSSLVAIFAACGPADAPPGDGGASEGTLPAAGGGTPMPDSSSGRTQDPETLPRVVFFGTSLTAGLGLPSPEDTYAGHAAELAAEAGVPFTPVYAGVSGETSAAGLRRIDWVLRQPLDILVLEIGANDGLRGLDVQAMRTNLTEIIHRTRARWPDARILLLGMEAPTNMGERYTEAFRKAFQDIAREEDTWFVPFFLDGVAGVPELNQSDGIHPTEEGHRAMARNIMPQLTAALEEVYAENSAAVGGAPR
jgi:acyl-CoA thioesterase-1